MGRVVLIVEGQTERAVLQQIDVATQFAAMGFTIHPKVVGKPGHKGGVRAFAKVLPEICALLKQEPTAKVSTFFDFYALPRATWPGYEESADLPPPQAVVCIEAGMAAAVAAALPGLPPGRFIPYIQMYELEALLFADPRVMADVFQQLALAPVFQEIATSCGGCESINNGTTTAPSKRIQALVPSYRKGSSVSAHAPIIVGQIARTNWSSLLAACPRFAAWLSRLV